ncbi:sodium channel protein Nach-like [Episyrphus balteatus]|uniref:sodium channel protein Nach-like n=1 Tax=Episyrphus balteatus TaxID=286459 RepID=UPI0024851598|nr:sodium channel protein Nach-like [Episyrphus balteatus]
MKISLGKPLKEALYSFKRRTNPACKKVGGKTVEILEEIGDSSGILAIKLVADRSLHWTERFLWFSLITLSVYAAYLISSKQLRRYRISPTVVSLDRDYRGWKGTMPAVTLCYYDHLDSYKADEYIQTKWNITMADEEYFYFMEFLYAIVNATASNYVELARFATDERFEDVDLNEALGEIYRTFDQTLKSFNPWFKIRVNPVMTERGRCYAINSPLSTIQAEKRNESESEVADTYEPLVCEFGKQPCFINLDIFESTGTIDVHSAYEVSGSDANIIPLRKSDEVIATYKVSETVASEKLRELTPKQRKCVFLDEETAQLPIYTKSLCLARCRAVMALEMCNCVPFFYPFVEGTSCNPAGFECLLDFKWPVWALHICNCPSTCTELQYTIQSIKRKSWGAKESNKPDAVASTFRWEVSPPKVRMRRDVVFSFEDLLVSFGGTLALFLGFSVLSIVYIANVLIYHGFDGIWTLTRFLWNLSCRPCQQVVARYRAINQVNAIRMMAHRMRKSKETAKRNNSSNALFEYLE